MYSWQEVWEFSQPLTAKPGEMANDEVVTFRPMSLLPVIIWDKEARARRVVKMRWGFPHRSNPMSPEPIHARSESIDEKQTFKQAFLDGQRGIVLMRTFNEGEEVPTKTGKTKTEQWTVDPGDGVMRGFAFLWRRFDIGGLPAPLLACVMVTVPASKLVRTIMENQDDPRMPAILENEDWATWLGENGATPDQAKSALKTMEDVNWQMMKEPKKPKPPKEPKPANPKKAAPEPGLF